MSAALPPDLDVAVREAASALERSPSGSLALNHRRRIWDAFGDSSAPLRSPAHLGRAVLDLLAAERVKPVWERTYPSYPIVDQVLDAARRTIAEGPSATSGEDLADRADREILDRMNTDGEYGAGYAGHSACAALMTALRTKSYEHVAPELDDDDLDPEDWDASYLASLAEAGGSADDPHADIERRRGFWRWYLAQAVPEAWGPVTGAPGRS